LYVYDWSTLDVSLPPWLLPARSRSCDQRCVSVCVSVRTMLVRKITQERVHGSPPNSIWRNMRFYCLNCAVTDNIDALQTSDVEDKANFMLLE